MDWGAAGAAALSGGLTGAMMPILGVTRLGATGLGLLSNVVQYSMTEAPERFSMGRLSYAAATGAAAGFVGGPFVKPELVSGLLAAKENIFAATPWLNIANTNLKGFAETRLIGASGISQLPAPGGI